MSVPLVLRVVDRCGAASTGRPRLERMILLHTLIYRAVVQSN